LYYPSSIEPDAAYKANGCLIRLNGNPQGRRSDCKWIEASRMFNATNILTLREPGQRKKENITIIVNFRNPKDNWGIIGFKIKTFRTESLSNGGLVHYLSDKLEGNQLIPNLLCKKPCYECKTENKGTPSKPVYHISGPNYCTKCWTSQPQKYLMTLSNWNPFKKTGKSTCKTKCDDGYTSNGNR
jgi:hypothetical protein